MNRSLREQDWKQISFENEEETERLWRMGYFGEGILEWRAVLVMEGHFFFFYLLFLSEVQSTYNVMLAKIWMKALGDWEMMGEREYDLGRSDSTNDKFISSSLDNDGLTIR